MKIKDQSIGKRNMKTYKCRSCLQKFKMPDKTNVLRSKMMMTCWRCNRYSFIEEFKGFLAFNIDPVRG